MYRLAARALEGLEKKEGSLKAIAFAVNREKGKKIYALAVETLKSVFAGRLGYGAIRRVIEECHLIPDAVNDSSKVCSVYVAVYDLLFGRGEVEGRGWPVNIVKKNASILRATWRELSEEFKGEEYTVRSPRGCAQPVRYVRINTLKGSVESVLRVLSGEGYRDISESEFWNSVMQSVETGDDVMYFSRDPCIDNLLVFPYQAPIQTSSLYKTGTLLLQDKASCIPAFVLSPPCDSHVIDACAAPGNKTTHLAAMLNNMGRIDAFEIDSKRFKTLKKMVHLAGATCVNMHCQDFLSVNPHQYSTVTHILLDPSCSGSGMASRIEHPGNLAKGPDKERLKSLAGFQLKALLHALCSFPSVEKVVYSTCSIYQEENEDVVKSALEKVNSRFELEHILPEWPIRGITSFPQAVCCVRTDPELNHTNGFFVALFKRTGSDCKVGNMAEKSKITKTTLDGSLKKVSKSRISKMYKRRKLKMSMRTYYIVPLKRSTRRYTTLWTHSHLLISKCRHW